MDNKKKEVEYLIHLLSCALNGKEVRHQEGIDYSTLLSLARKHQVYNIIFPLIKDDLSVHPRQADRGLYAMHLLSLELTSVFYHIILYLSSIFLLSCFALRQNIAFNNLSLVIHQAQQQRKKRQRP